MSKLFEAKGLTSTGWGADSPWHMGLTITDGLKAAIGRNIRVSLNDRDLVFLMSSLAEVHPELIVGTALEISKCDAEYGQRPKPPSYDQYLHQRSRRIRDAASAALQGEGR